MRLKRAGVFVAAFGLLLGLSGPVGSSVTQTEPTAEPSSWIICNPIAASAQLDENGTLVVNEAVGAPWAPGGVALKPGDPMPEPDTDPDNMVQPPIVDGSLIDGRGAGEGTQYKVKIDQDCDLDVGPAGTPDAAEPTLWIICLSDSVSEVDGKLVINTTLPAPWGTVQAPLEPGDPMPELDTNPDNQIQPPIVDGSLIDGRGVGEGNQYKVLIQPECGPAEAAPSEAAPPSSPSEPAPSETAPPSGPGPSVLKPSFTG